MIRGGGTGDVTKTHMEWNLDTKAPSNIASPLVVNDQVFVVKEGGISAAFSAADGKTQWPRRRIRNLGHYYASPFTVTARSMSPAKTASSSSCSRDRN
ncbi:MAG: hypothetical protein CM1200mP2_43350 [Planctomycetaceae bacterium]|nr:MAG: hypothetical protein CM1200mP2_43350 [Planctomycetaceae bacterium]